MKQKAIILLCLFSTACQQAVPPWDAIAFLIGDDGSPKKTEEKPSDQH